MIVQFVLSVLLIIYFFGFGLIFQKIFPKLNSSLSFTILNGMIGVGLLSFFFAFFVPLNLTYEIILIIISIISLVYHRNEIIDLVKKMKGISLYFYIFSFVGLLITVTYPYVLDHFVYYVPTIKWLDYAGFVKGLSNFEWVLGQNSFWHILQAATNESLDVYYRLNLSLFIVFNLYIFEFKYYRLLFLNGLFLFFLNIPSPDLPVFILSALLINEYLNSYNPISDYLFYAVILFVIKPISIVLLLFFGIEYLNKKEFKGIKDKNLFLIIFVTVLFIFKGIILSANPIFPLGFTSLESLSWASPKSLYELSGNYGKFIPLKNSFTYQEVIEMNLLDYVKAILFFNSSRSLIIIFILCLTLFSTLISVYRKKKILLFLTICCWVKLVLMLFFSPQFRFLLDILVIDGLIIITLLDWKTFFQYSKPLSLGCVSLITILIVFPFMKTISLGRIKSFSYVRKIEFQQILIPGNYDDLRASSKQLGNLIYNYPENYPMIYSTPVPGISFSTLKGYLLKNGFPKQINANDVKKGFYFNEMDEKNRKEIHYFLMKEQKKQVK